MVRVTFIAHQNLQSMRSATYVHPGEQLTCVGCHEDQNTSPLRRATLAAGQLFTLGIRAVLSAWDARSGDTDSSAANRY